MNSKAVIILGDLGGTHLRLSRLSQAGPADIRVYPVQDHDGIEGPLRHYATDRGFALAGAQCFLSCATRMADGWVRFDPTYRGHGWAFHVEGLRAALGLTRLDVLHDFRAMALAVMSQRAGVFTPLRPGHADRTETCCVLGVGTGIGHAFLQPHTARIQDTHGGHFPLFGVTDRQRAIVDHVRASWQEPRTLIFEEVLSGRGLLKLYQAACDMDGTAPDASLKSPSDLLSLPAHSPVLKTLGADFAGFLGVYAHTLCVVAHAYGGVYLTGGVIERLRDLGAFDLPSFEAQYHQTMVPVVRDALQAAPLWAVGVPHTALYGLEVYAHPLKLMGVQACA